MQLCPREVCYVVFAVLDPANLIQLDKLVISQLGLLAQRRLARGVKLNHSEATVRELDVHKDAADVSRR
jgi:urease gamma subunit